MRKRGIEIVSHGDPEFPLVLQKTQPSFNRLAFILFSFFSVSLGLLNFIVIYNDIDPVVQHASQLSQLNYQYLPAEKPVSLVIVNWVRFQNLPVITCDTIKRYNFIKEVVIWNNNPSMSISRDTLPCIDSSRRFIRVQTINSKTNIVVEGRFLGCKAANYDICAFIDDDFMPVSLDVLYKSFLSDPTRLHATTNAANYWNSLRRTFFDEEIQLHAGFSWVGSGAIVSKQVVIDFLETLDYMSLNRQGRDICDNYFSILMNSVPQQFIVELHPLFMDGAFTDSATKRFLLDSARRKAIMWLHQQLLESSNPHYNVVQLEQKPFASGKALSQIEPAIFITNIEQYDVNKVHFSPSNLDSHMEWIETDEQFKQQVKKWSENPNYKDEKSLTITKEFFDHFSYLNAVDLDPESAWNSGSNLKPSDWVGLDLQKIQYFQHLSADVGSQFPIYDQIISVSLDACQTWQDVTDKIEISTKKRWGNKAFFLPHFTFTYRLRPNVEELPFRCIRVSFNGGDQGPPLVLYNIQVVDRKYAHLPVISAILFLFSLIGMVLLTTRDKWSVNAD
eukprot:Lithocolla_globosa_v1_NODE_2280_length_2071_cov_3.345734.p1 type:complete len:561 gc:universal NODE_2280_length_2071_cov_3.345734:1706-24(-)